MNIKYVLLVAIILTLVFALFSYAYFFLERDTNELHDVCIFPQNYTMTLAFNNATNNYDGISLPIKYSNNQPVQGANVSVQLNGSVFWNITDSNGLSHFSFPKILINNLDLTLKYKFTATKEGYENMTWESRFEIAGTI